MGVSTDAQLSFGVAFPEGFEFPWSESDEEEERDIEDWWRDETGYSEGDYPQDREAPDYDERWNAVYQAKKAWSDAHPLPVELVDHCSDDCVMYILAVPSSVHRASRGYPEDLGSGQSPDISVTEEERQTLEAFIARYVYTDLDEEELDEPLDLKARWILSSYWG